MAGGIDGIRAQRYSLPIHSHLVACANTKFAGMGHIRVCVYAVCQAPWQKILPISPVQSSNKQPHSAFQAGLQEEI